MATFDQLSAQQRAIIELVLRQGKTYAELSDMLDMSEQRVRDLARESLAELAPVTAQAVEEDWRGQLVDYLLGQQSGPELTATRGHLRRSEPARAWTRSLLDSLDFLYPNGLPQIPESGGSHRRERASATASGPLTPEARAAVLRRRIIAGSGIAVLLLVVVLLWPIGLLTGGDDDDKSDGGGQTSGNQQAATNQPAGVAVVALRDGKYRLVLQAANLPALKRNQAYEVWLYNSQGDAQSLGAQVLDQNGGLSGQSQAIPRTTLDKYRSVDISLEAVNSDRSHSDTSVLRGRLAPIRDATPKQGQAAPVSQAVLRPPRS